MCKNPFTNQRNTKGSAALVQSVMAVFGLSVSVVAYVAQPFSLSADQSQNLRAVLLIALGCGLGFLLRVARRYVFFLRHASVHTLFSFEALFQGAIAFNPQLEYPGVESAFVGRYARVPREELAGWFKVRSTSAIAIPMCLLGAVFALGGHLAIAAVCLVLCLVWLAVKAFGVEGRTQRALFFSAEVLGILAALAEGFVFAYACFLLVGEGGLHGHLLLYLILLSLYEFSPIPFALGVLELGYIAVSFLGVAALPGLIVVLAYRLCRLLVLPVALFYLPTYKLNLKDIYNPELSLILRKYRRPEGGWAPEDSSDGAVLLSIIIPAYNEAERLPNYLPDVLDYCKEKDFATQVLVVDDGSTDSTADYVEGLAASHRILQLIRQPHNMGKGAAVKRGALAAEGSYVLFADADGATPIREADALLEVAETGIEVVIASRSASGGDVRRSFVRKLVGATFYRLTNLLAVPSVSDTQCGFKMFRNFAAQKIFSQVRESGWAFDVEVLFLAQKYDYAIKEVPVEWNAVPGSKIDVVRDSLGMLWALWRIRRRSSGMSDMG